VVLHAQSGTPPEGQHREHELDPPDVHQVRVP
jgi:hypothetical protein